MQLVILVAFVIGIAGTGGLSAQTINPTDGGTRPPTTGSQSIQSSSSGYSPSVSSSGASSGGEAVDATLTSELQAPMGPMPENPVQQDGNTDLPALSEDGVALPGASDGAGTGFKKWRLRPTAGVGYAYDDNIYISNTNRVASGIGSISGGLAFDYGDYLKKKENFLTVNYLGTGYLFSQTPQLNCYNQLASLLGQYRWDRFFAQLESRYQNINGAQRDVGNFTTRSLLQDSLSLFYEYSVKTLLDFKIQQMANYYPNNLSSYDYQAKLGGGYQATDKVNVGAEGLFGLNPAQDSPTRLYQALNARFKYEYTDKLAFKATGGILFNEFSTGGQPLYTTPVFSLGLDYKLFSEVKDHVDQQVTPTQQLFNAPRGVAQALNGSSLSLLFYRNYQSSSAYTDLAYMATGGQLGITKPFGPHWVAGVAFGYENDTYIAIRSGTSATRVDNFFFVKPNVRYDFLKNLSASVYYQRSFNNSTIQSYQWFDNRFGVEINTAF